MGNMFFKKNKIDLDRGAVVSWAITDSVATDTGQSFADYLRDRSNDSGWATTGSSDAGGTRILVSFGETHEFTTLFLIKMNWKSYTIKYWNGASYVNFSTPISETVNATETKRHTFTAVESSGLEIVISGTMTADQDKRCCQLIVTSLIGDLGSTMPAIEEITVGRNKRLVRTASGKTRVQRGVGALGFRFRHPGVACNSSAWTLIQALHDYHNGFLVWLGGGTLTQFPGSSAPIGYRLEDLYLMNIASELRPAFNNGRFNDAIPLDLEMWEAV